VYVSGRRSASELTQTLRALAAGVTNRTSRARVVDLAGSDSAREASLAGDEARRNADARRVGVHEGLQMI
jgi:hypothetical protein